MRAQLTKAVAFEGWVFDEDNMLLHNRQVTFNNSIYGNQAVYSGNQLYRTISLRPAESLPGQPHAVIESLVMQKTVHGRVVAEFETFPDKTVGKATIPMSNSESAMCETSRKRVDPVEALLCED